MKAPKSVALLLIIAVAGAGVYFWPRGEEPGAGDRLPGRSAGSQGVPSSRAEEAPGTATGAGNRALEERLASLESSVAKLSKTVEAMKQDFDGVSIEKASADRQALFGGEEGYLKADEYFEAGKYAIAGEGYLTFLKNHPTHPDAREVMKKARDAFLKAGYKDKAFWVQDEMMKANPQHKFTDMAELANLEKEAGMYDKAAGHMAEAAELAPNPEERLWRRLYWAWYVQLGQGPAAGVTALQQVQQEIAASGVSNPKLTEHASRRLVEWQQLLPVR